MKLCKFDECCSFGKGSSLGDKCILEQDGDFEKDCSFGEHCVFEDRCNFGEGSSFGWKCIFNTCKIGQDSRFGEGCIFEGKCIVENEHITKDIFPLLSFNGFGYVNKTIYFFNCEDGIWVRFGGFFGTIEQFRERVKKTQTGRLGKEYLMIADLVEMKWR